MKLWKSLLAAVITYVVLTVLCNILVVWATAGAILGLASFGEYFTVDIWMLLATSVTGVDGFNPVSVEIFTAMGYAVDVLPSAASFMDYVGPIALILVPIIPGLGASIASAKIGRTAKNGFFGMFITGILAAVVPISMLWLNEWVIGHYGLLLPVYAEVTSTWLRAVFTGVIGVLIASFWGGLAAFFGRES